MENEILKQILDAQNKMNSSIKELYEGQKELYEGQNEMRISIKDLYNGQEEMKASIKDLYNGQKEMKASIKDLYNGQKEMKASMKDLKDKVDDIDRVVMKIEVEHGDKIKTLFDAVTINNENIKNLEKKTLDRLDSIEYKLLDHDSRIEKLEKKIV